VEPLRAINFSGCCRSVIVDVQRAWRNSMSEGRLKNSNYVPKSLAWAKFVKRMEAESRLYWSIACSLEYAKRWWDGLPPDQVPDFISRYPDDDVDPFKRVHIPPSTFNANKEGVLSMVAENTVVSFVTAFEVYLFEVAQRAFFIKPELLRESDLQFTAHELSHVVGRHDMRTWFSKAVADRLIRSRHHAEVIEFLNSTLKLGFVLDKNKRKYDSRVEEWRLWELVRNSIVHAARTVSVDLAERCSVVNAGNWSRRFAKVGAGLALKSNDIAAVSKLARELADAIDKRFRSEIVKDLDDEILIREVFVNFGIDDPTKLIVRVGKTTKSKLSRQSVEKIIAHQKKTEQPVVGYDFAGLIDI
jgi:hypothetical protein